MIEILAAGPDTTLQSLPRRGWRHVGVPASGAADGLSAALALRLVDQPRNGSVIEFTLAGGQIRFHAEMAFALTGALAVCTLNGQSIQQHHTLYAEPGDTLSIGPPTLGLRTYLAVGGSIKADEIFSSLSTYVPAKLGGYFGRALRAGDRIDVNNTRSVPTLETPRSFIPPVLDSWHIRAVSGPEFEVLMPASQSRFFCEPFQMGRQLSRMGGALVGGRLELNSDGRMASSAVFPGTVQCPENGEPFLLMADAQTTGGYPRVAQAISADRHMLGQLRPGAKVRFIRTDLKDAADTLRSKTAFLREWLGAEFLLNP